MKTSMNLLLWTTHLNLEHQPLLKKLAKAGYDGVEVPVFQGEVGHYQKMGRMLRELGLGCSTVTVMSGEKDPISAQAGVRKAGLAHLKYVIECSAALGGDIVCGPLHSALGKFSGKAPTEEERKRAAQVLHQAGEFAAQCGVKLAVEYLNRFETYLVTTAADNLRLVKMIDHPAVGLMWDTFHAHIEEKDSEAAIAKIARHLIHVHISENDRGEPGSGQVHWQQTFKALRKAKYDGWLTIEAFSRALPDLAAATKVWRDLFVKPEHVYQRGLSFMQRMWQQS